MATFIQSYAKGYIAREGDKYQYVESGEVKGTYDTVEQLVNATTKGADDGKQDREDSAATEATADEVVSKPSRKSRKAASKE